jgi:MFS family permease
MISSMLVGALRRRDIHYGWVVVGVTFLTMLVTAGALGAPGILMVPLEKEFGWDTAEISSAMALRFVLFGLMAPFAAVFLNRLGVRRMAIIALGTIIFGLAVSLFMREVWQLVALWGVLLGVGSGLTAMVLGATVATRWFVQRRGLVMGFLSATNATGQLIFQPIFAHVTVSFGWRSTVSLICAMLAGEHCVASSCA